jgi:hypothetical protein
MQRLVNRGNVRITPRDGTDRYGRTVVSVSVGGSDPGMLLLRARCGCRTVRLS